MMYYPWNLQNRAVAVTAKFMQKALAKRVKATIIFATETGTSERYATMLKAIFDLKFNVKVTLTQFNDVLWWHKIYSWYQDARIELDNLI